METFTNQPENGYEEKEQRIKKILDLVKKLGESQEVLNFPGIDQGSYLKMKSEEKILPGYATPIDELIERFEKEGIKVVLGNHPDSGNVFVLPTGSNDIENDSILIQHLQVDMITNENLRKLVLICKNK